MTWRGLAMAFTLATCAACLVLMPACTRAAPVESCPSRAEAAEAGGGTICILLDSAVPAGQQTELRAWIARSARIVSAYYERFPARQVVLAVSSSSGHGVHGGHTNNEPRLQIDVTVGRDTGAAELSADWVLVHEMIHLALPEVGRRHNWLAEGLATYVEGIARARAGNRPDTDVWAEYRGAMPRGLPQPGEGGMDETRSWARTYWGGALFCLQADVAIRERTANRLGLETALRAILNETGGYASERDLEAVLRIGDRATGTAVLMDLYRSSAESAYTPDLDALWSKLGIPVDPRTQALDEHAPEAAIRRSITRAH